MDVQLFPHLQIEAYSEVAANLIKCRALANSPPKLLEEECKETMPKTWKDIVHVGKKKPTHFSNFFRNTNLKVGKGKEISFWQNVWFENGSLKSNVPRLYTLVLAEDENLCHIYKRRGDDGIWNFLIRRGLFAWEEEELQG